MKGNIITKTKRVEKSVCENVFNVKFDFDLWHSSRAKISWFFFFWSMFVFLLVIVRHRPDNDRSALLPHDEEHPIQTFQHIATSFNDFHIAILFTFSVLRSINCLCCFKFYFPVLLYVLTVSLDHFVSLKKLEISILFSFCVFFCFNFYVVLFIRKTRWCSDEEQVMIYSLCRKHLIIIEPWVLWCHNNVCEVSACASFFIM